MCSESMGLGNVIVTVFYCLLQVCVELDLFIASTMFRQKDKFKTTWMHPGSKQWHLINYVLVRRGDVQHLRQVRAKSGADCRTEHRLVRAKAYFVIKPRVRAKGVILPKRLNVGRIKDENVQEEQVNWKSFKV